MKEEDGQYVAHILSEGEANIRNNQRISVVRYPGDVEGTQQLETELEKERATVANSRRVIEDLMREVEEQKKTIEALKGERHLFLANQGRRERAWDAQKADLERLVMRQEVTINKQNAEIQDLKNEYKEASNCRWESERHIQAVKEDLREAREDVGRERMQLGELKRLFSETERRLETTEKLLKTRTDELTAAQAFITTADQCSGTDVSHMVTQLNDDVYQCAALMADEVIKRDGIEEQLGEAALAHLATASQELITFGWNQALVQRLRPDILEQETVLFEAMVQNIFNYWCYRIISSFCYESGEVNQYLTGLWQSIVRSSEFCDKLVGKVLTSIHH